MSSYRPQYYVSEYAHVGEAWLAWAAAEYEREMAFMDTIGHVRMTWDYHASAERAADDLWEAAELEKAEAWLMRPRRETV
ncbi:hypothetical protein ACIRQY_29045 [Streptomyces sp. NPDC101490]|uniref:hypothetical protein n=1 Tax=Streptomyces sp. NPDC101490 TaxID=3366143 RepID=UPI003829B7CE